MKRQVEIPIDLPGRPIPPARSTPPPPPPVSSGRRPDDRTLVDALDNLADAIRELAQAAQVER